MAIRVDLQARDLKEKQSRCWVDVVWDQALLCLHFLAKIDITVEKPWKLAKICDLTRENK